METIPVFAIIIALTIISAAIVFVARKLEQPIIPGALTIVYLMFLIYHSVKLNSVALDKPELLNIEYYYLAVGFALLLLSFISFLWIDDIVAKKKNKKSYDDSLSWFWDKI